MSGSWSWSSSWHQWDGGGAPPSASRGSAAQPRWGHGGGGGGGRGRGGAAQGTPPRRAASEDELIYSTFPLNKQEFAEDGPNSFRELKQSAENAGCEVTLRSRRTQHLQRRAHAVLVIRGPSCREVYAMFLDAAFALGADLRMVLLPHEVQRQASRLSAAPPPALTVAGEPQVTEPQAQPAAAARQPLALTWEPQAGAAPAQPAEAEPEEEVDWNGADDDDNAKAAEDRVQVVTAPPVAVVAEPGGRAPAPSGVAADVVDAIMRLPVHIHEEPGLSLPTDVAEAVRRSLLNEDAPLEVKLGVMISLCTVVYGRGYQLRAAMGPNLAHLRRHWRYARWVVVLCKDDFGGRPREDLDLEEWVRQHYSAFIDAGLLAVVRALPDVDDGAHHASRAKNTSHAAAVTVHRASVNDDILVSQPFKWVAGVDDEADKDHILVNLDCDNIMGGGFIKSVVDSFGVSASAIADARIGQIDSVAWHGHEAATTGRVAGSADLFLRLRGYDEEGVMGSGYEDQDLIHRYEKAGRRQVRVRCQKKGARRKP